MSLTTAEYDRLAALFYQETGLPAPGKPWPPGAHAPPYGVTTLEDEVDRRTRWAEFIRVHRQPEAPGATCARCQCTTDAPIRRQITDIDVEFVNGRPRRYVRTRLLDFCSEEHAAHYQMSTEG